MTTKRLVRLSLASCLFLACTGAVTLAEDDTCTPDGVTVVIGLDDVSTLLQFPPDRTIVHGLDTDLGKVTAARRALTAAGRYGQITVSRFDGKQLPYIDCTVNTAQSGTDGAHLRDEINRVLVPGGRSILNGVTTVKPSRTDTDEWTHYLYGPDNNAVSNDDVVGPPRRMQWVAGPRYSRHHDRMSSLNAVVSAGGKVFTIIDEGPSWSILMPPRWALTGRDAYNGKLLWKREIGTWSNHLHGLKSGPASLPRRLAAVDGYVYATLGLDAPVEQIDASSGETARLYAETTGTTELLISDGVCYAVCGPLPDGQWYKEGDRAITAVNLNTGAVLWRTGQWVVPGTLAVLDGQLYFYERDRVTCKSAYTGKTLWQSTPVPRPERYHSRFMPTLVATDKVVLIAGGEAANKGGWSTKGAKDTITALDSATGKTLWAAHHPDSGYASPEDVFVIDGKVWFGDSRDGAKPGNTYGLDLNTGEVKVTFPPSRDIYFFHHRCYRAKATKNYLLTSRAGIELVDFRRQQWDVNHWVRGACLYGVVPANGLIYAPQHPCACYLETKLDGFNALAAARGPRLPGVLPERLEKGPAFGASTVDVPRAASPTDWPTYRYDSTRSGSSPTPITAQSGKAFAIETGGRITSPVVSGNLLVVAAPDRHAVCAYDTARATPKWEYIAGGEVDSPPTLWRGLVLFGCRDGHIYCLRASDGELAWRFRAAPVDERLVVYERLESVWPVHGSVLIRDGVLYAAAGRSVFLDGGLRLVRLDAVSGRLLSETVLDGHAKVDGRDMQDYVSWLNMPAGKPDIMSSVDAHVYMRSQAFTPDGTPLALVAKPMGRSPDAGAPPPKQNPEHAHLFCPTGFCDDTGWHRTYWLYGSDFYSGWQGYFTAGKATPAGKILVSDANTVYGFGRRQQYWRWTVPMEFHFFAAAHDKVGTMDLTTRRRRAPAPPEAGKTGSYLWSKHYALLARAMCKAGDTIYVAGPRDVFDEQSRQNAPGAELKQLENWMGTKGGVLLAIAAKTGEAIGGAELAGVPVFDGLIASGGDLYCSTTDGKILALNGREISTDVLESLRMAAPPAPKADAAVAPLKRGKLLSPPVANKPFTVTAIVEAKAGAKGVILAHGGRNSGYALFAEKGIPVFILRNGSAVSRIAATQALPVGKSSLVVSVSKEALTLTLNDREVARGPGVLLARQPIDKLSTGYDNIDTVPASCVGDWTSEAPFSGKVEAIQVK